MTVWKKNVLLSAFFIVAMLGLLTTTLKANRAAMTYPYVLMGFVVFFSFILLLQNVVGGAKSAGKGTVAGSISSKALLMIAVCSVAMLVYIVSIGTLGYLLSTFLFMVAVMLYLKEKKWYRILLVPAGTAGFLYALFSMVLKVTLPSGSLFG